VARWARAVNGPRSNPVHTSCVEALDAAIATTSTLNKLLVVSTNPTLFIVAAVATIVLVRRRSYSPANEAVLEGTEGGIAELAEGGQQHDRQHHDVGASGVLTVDEQEPQTFR